MTSSGGEESQQARRARLDNKAFVWEVKRRRQVATPTHGAQGHG